MFATQTVIVGVTPALACQWNTSMYWLLTQEVLIGITTRGIVCKHECIRNSCHAIVKERNILWQWPRTPLFGDRCCRRWYHFDIGLDKHKNFVESVLQCFYRSTFDKGKLQVLQWNENTAKHWQYRVQAWRRLCEYVLNACIVGINLVLASVNANQHLHLYQFVIWLVSFKNAIFFISSFWHLSY